MFPFAAPAANNAQVGLGVLNCRISPEEADKDNFVVIFKGFGNVQ